MKSSKPRKSFCSHLRWFLTCAKSKWEKWEAKLAATVNAERLFMLTPATQLVATTVDMCRPIRRPKYSSVSSLKNKNTPNTNLNSNVPSPTEPNKVTRKRPQRKGRSAGSPLGLVGFLTELSCPLTSCSLLSSSLLFSSVSSSLDLPMLFCFAGDDKHKHGVNAAVYWSVW